MTEISDDENWECHLCGREDDYEQPACGWIGDCHMLCRSCADSIYSDSNSKFHQALTYHYAVGDIRTEIRQAQNDIS
jgi:hypothetical protein